MSKSSLATYREKRRYDRTPEPFGGSPGTGVGAFCVQKHAARRAGVHMDLRLELAGVLKSWAVPKGISPDPDDKRYAHETEDHPIEYVEFEGVIPEGEYGGGEMILWDIGRWVPLEDPAEGLVAGKLLFELRGHKLKGVWTLVRLAKSDTRRDWLLIRERRGGHPVLSPDDLPDTSILSGLTVEELARREEGWDPAASMPDRLEAAGAEPRRVEPTSVKPMLAQEGEGPFDDPDWSFELKLDGYRVLGSVSSEEPLLLTRNGNDVTASFPDIARALRAWPFEHVVLDGEVVVHDGAGLPNFQRLQKRARLSRPLDVRRASFEAPASFYAFDLLGFGDFDLRGLPLVERKAFLQELVPPAGPIRYSEHFPGAGTALFARVEELGLEGIMAKRSASAYVGERSADWLKIHAARRDRFVVVGFTRPMGSRAGFGALHLGYFDGEPGTREGELVYTGRVGSGFDDATLRALRERLDEGVRDRLPMSGPVPTGDEHVWVEPELVARVRYKEATDEGLLRQPVFEELEDVPPGDCIPPSGTRAALDEPVEVETGAPPIDEIPLSNLDKPFWPDEGYTKGDLIDYYGAIAPWLLPWLADRPLVLTRYPDGIRGKSFFQKNAPGFQPDWIRT
ncbi:MAG: non-homologous end-joining DNA ligase, partial [Gemmatimonadota bacterium]|nr:non-homologous end-joining DNA ligase [Gemmatimonadota bacterium]